MRKRIDARDYNQLRPVSIRTGFNLYAESSVEISWGNTLVHVTASVEDRVPAFLKGTGKGWLTAEYNMLPRATHSRNQREGRGNRSLGGRTQEIQRLIGRSLRAVTDLYLLPERSIIIDCDVLQADGGTRTASITAAWLALVLASNHLIEEGVIARTPVLEQLAAVSVGVLNGRPILDMSYQEDSAAQVDMNIIMTGAQDFVEIQGTGEESTFSLNQLKEMLALAQAGLAEIFYLQLQVLKENGINWGK